MATRGCREGLTALLQDPVLRQWPSLDEETCGRGVVGGGNAVAEGYKPKTRQVSFTCRSHEVQRFAVTAGKHPEYHFGSSTDTGKAKSWQKQLTSTSC